MAVAQFSGDAVSNGMANRSRECNPVIEATRAFSPQHSRRIHSFSRLAIRKRLSYADVVRRCSLTAKHWPMLESPIIHRRKHIFRVPNYQSSSDSGVHSSDVDETPSTEEHDLSSSRERIPEAKGIGPSETSNRSGKKLTGKSTSQSRHQDVKRELVMLSLPAIAGQAVDPFAQLMETAYIGRLGPVELASAGVSISIFNIISKLFNMPLVSVATSVVAEDLSKNGVSSPTGGKMQQLSSVSTALTLAVGIGIFEAVALSLGSGLFLNLMGISSADSMHAPAQRFLSLRALGAPANVVSLALQGIFRGFKDTKTPVLCLGIGNFSAIFLLPILIYYFRLGVTGAAISTVVSQYIVTFLMMWFLNKRVVLLSPKVGALRFGGYLKSGGLLLGRTLALLTTTTLATSMAARQGPLAMAAHQICLQVWLAVSLLTDALAVSAQSLIATSISQGDYRTVEEVTYFVLKIGLVTGVALALVLGVSFGTLATLFTSDADVLGIVRTGVLFVGASQPLNSLAFIFDGLHYGASDFAFAARSMMLVGTISSMFLLYASPVFGLPGVWCGLTLFMGLRTVAGFIRLMSKSGPWWFLHKDLKRTEALIC